MIPSKWKYALIDGDRIVMGAGFGAQTMEKGKLVSVDPIEVALYKAKRIIHTIKSTITADEYKIYIGDPTVKHFRYKVATTLGYKANRKDVVRPVHEQSIRDYLTHYHEAIVVTGVEVDDALGIAQYSALTNDLAAEFDGMSVEGTHEDWVKMCANTIICSNDKDLDMIPGWHFDIDYGIVREMNGKKYTMKAYKKLDVYFISDPGFLSLRIKLIDGKVPKKPKKKLVGAGQLWFCAQLLMGDTVDNIPGVPYNAKCGFGDVRAYNVLKDCKTYEDGIKKVWNIYKTNLPEYEGLTEEQTRARIKEVAQLLWIKRAVKEKIFPKEWLI
jgi:hypothetical protein